VKSESMRVRISQLAAFRALTKFARVPGPALLRTLLLLDVVHATCYATSSYVIHLTGAPSFGEAQPFKKASARLIPPSLPRYKAKRLR